MADSLTLFALVAVNGSTHVVTIAGSLRLIKRKLDRATKTLLETVQEPGRIAAQLPNASSAIEVQSTPGLVRAAGGTPSVGTFAYARLQSAGLPRGRWFRCRLYNKRSACNNFLRQLRDIWSAVSSAPRIFFRGHKKMRTQFKSAIFAAFFFHEPAWPDDASNENRLSRFVNDDQIAASKYSIVITSEPVSRIRRNLFFVEIKWLLLSFSTLNLNRICQ